MKMTRSRLATFVRLFLALTFTVYGTVKLSGGQFYHGDWTFDSRTDSPVGLVWAFFGYSQLYSFFIGFSQVAVAVLLAIPRTATIGAIALLPITVNITVLDFAYDFPEVRYFSLFLTSLTLWLLFMDRQKLMGLLNEKKGSR